MSKDRVFQLCDTVREIGLAIHRYHGPGHLEKVYENALVHRLRKRGLEVKQQHPLTVYDEDGTVLGEYFVDLLIEEVLIVELKAVSSVSQEHVAQLLGYLRASRIGHGLLVNFGALRFSIKKYVLSDPGSQQIGQGGMSLWTLLAPLVSLFASLCGHSCYSSPALVVDANTAFPLVFLFAFHCVSLRLFSFGLLFFPEEKSGARLKCNHQFCRGGSRWAFRFLA